jgi:hypothetical protein
VRPAVLAPARMARGRALTDDSAEPPLGRSSALPSSSRCEHTAAQAARYGPQWRAVLVVIGQAPARPVPFGIHTRDVLSGDAVRWIVEGEAAVRAADLAGWGECSSRAARAATAAVGSMAWNAAYAAATRHLVGQHGYTAADYDALMGRWEAVMGDPFQVS